MYITGVGFGFIVGIVIFGILDSTHLLTGPRLHRSSPEQSKNDRTETQTRTLPRRAVKRKRQRSSTVHHVRRTYNTEHTDDDAPSTLRFVSLILAG